MKLPKLIDNKRVILANLIKEQASNHDELSIATGYWDLEGTLEIIESIKNYKKVRLIIGEEPISPIQRYQVTMNFDLGKLTFPKDYIEYDLSEYGKLKDANRFRIVSKEMSKMINEGRLQIKIFKNDNGNKRLHAKAYIFGNEKDQNSIGIIGSSNFTKAGLTSNTELNSLEDQVPMVVYPPSGENMPHTHLSWFNELWNDENTIDWSGEFRAILEKSPVGDVTFGPYDVYIKTLMEVFSDELNPPTELGDFLKDKLFPFQNRNAGLLINKLEKLGLAMLADSVGLGKTITAGAVIKHYLDTKDNANILVISPAALKQQWMDDLLKIIDVDHITGDYKIISQQDYNAIRKLKNDYDNSKRIMRKIDLIVIDEAHNLRSPNGVRYEAILDLLQQHADAKILLLTATPVNNSLIDIANQIKLASKGKRTYVNVPYSTPEKNEIEMLDYFEALDRIQKQLRKNEKAGKDTNKLLESFKPTIHSGLRHFLVRSTRQGVEAEGSLKNSKGEIIRFPKSNVNNLNYVFSKETSKKINEIISKEVTKTFENFDPRRLNVDLFTELTQITNHPLEIILNEKKNNGYIQNKYKIGSKKIEALGEPFTKNYVDKTIENIVQVIFTLGFTPYRPHIYDAKYYGKAVADLDRLEDIPLNVKIQFSVHNILHVTWLKRLESSGASLLNSVNNYLKRIELFEKFLNKNFIVSLSEAELLENDYGDGEDLEKAFEDYNEYLREKEKFAEEGKDEKELRRKGVEKIEANPDRFNTVQMKLDLQRDKNILSVLKRMIQELINNDPKVIELKNSFLRLLKDNNFGKKIIVFSFFADTIHYLENVLPNLLKETIPDFGSTSAFITGSSKNLDRNVGLFSPVSKNYVLKYGEKELNFLFSTDVLSEGQNLQDSGILINYDLHWNPVRMIQRNGRINRLGSKYDKVLIANMKPANDLDLYLKLVNRLENKIKTIKNTIGLDQGVLADSDENPIQFIEKYYNDGTLPDSGEKLFAHTDLHLIALRKFLDKNKENQYYIDKIKNIPIGKWNYLPRKNVLKDHSLALVSVHGIKNDTKQTSKDLFFVDIECKDFYKATYIDYNLALDYIKADETDNTKKKDSINCDRHKVADRAINESNRQFNNPNQIYEIKPQQNKVTQIMLNYFDKRVDLIGTIRFGIRTTNIAKEFESLIREITTELKKTNSTSPNSTSISKFVNFINKLNKDIINSKDTKIIEKIEGVLYYASE